MAPKFSSIHLAAIPTKAVELIGHESAIHRLEAIGFV
jgi:hypothetical protein